MHSDRRQFVAAAMAAPLSVFAASRSGAQPVTRNVAAPQKSSSFRYCLNTSTIRGQELGIEKEVDVTAAAGYDGIEPWIPTLRQFVEKGGSLADLRKRIDDHGLTVDSAIGFAQWIVDDASRRKDALEEARRDMDMLAQIGGTRIAAPPVGAHQSDSPAIDLRVAGERFRALQDLGDQIGVVPQLEVWGFSRNLSRISEVLYVVAESGHPRPLLLLDAYHIHKGGSDFAGLNLISDDTQQVFHLNDYPAEPARAELNDSHRVYPGLGVAPLSQILTALGGGGRSITLSLELFNRDYWAQDAAGVAKTGLASMKAAVAAAEATWSATPAGN
jgi:2-keto-myo-inositol isomerase